VLTDEIRTIDDEDAVNGNLNVVVVNEVQTEPIAVEGVRHLDHAPNPDVGRLPGRADHHRGRASSAEASVPLEPRAVVEFRQRPTVSRFLQGVAPGTV